MQKQRELPKLILFLPWLLLVPCILFIVFLLFFYNDFPQYLGTEKSWINTAQVLNGFLTPILTIASIILLFLTWLTTKAELEDTKNTLNNQMILQMKRDELDVISRQSINLNQRFTELIPVINLIGMENLIKMNLVITKLEIGNDVETHLLNTSYSIRSLINKLENVEAYSFEKGYFKNALETKPFSYQRIIHNQVAYFYFSKERPEINSYFHIIQKIDNSPKEYKKDLEEEFSLNFPSDVSDKLTKFKSNTANY